MSTALPARPNLDWLRKTARQQLKALRAARPAARLTDAQLELARTYGFTSWRALKAHVDRLQVQSAQPVSTTDEASAAAFLQAVGSGETDTVRSLLAASPLLVNAIGPHPYWSGRPQPLHLAIETSRRDVFDQLLTAGADVNGQNERYEQSSPLMLTFLWNRPDMRQALLARGAKVGLMEALLSGDDAHVEQLLRRGDPEIPNYRPNGGSILAMARTPFALDRLLDLGAPRDLPDRWKTPPLEAMSRLGAAGIPLVQHLLRRGFHVGAQEFARMGDLQSLKQLLDTAPALVDIDAVLRDAAGFGHEAILKWALSHGAAIDSQADGGGWTALHSAAWEGNLPLVKLLVEAGASLEVRDSEHRSTPAQTARVAVTVTNNPDCAVVADYLDSMRAL